MLGRTGRPSRFFVGAACRAGWISTANRSTVCDSAAYAARTDCWGNPQVECWILSAYTMPIRLAVGYYGPTRPVALCGGKKLSEYRQADTLMSLKRDR